MNTVATQDLTRTLEPVPDVRTRALPCTACARSGSACHAKAVALTDQHAELLSRVVATALACARGQAGRDDVRASLGRVEQIFGGGLFQNVCAFQARTAVPGNEPRCAPASPRAANTAALLWFD